jgi:hypothetical protein
LGALNPFQIEVWKIKWIDIDFVNLTIRVTPDKREATSNVQNLELLAMISALKRKPDKIFRTYDLKRFKAALLSNAKGQPTNLEIH